MSLVLFVFRASIISGPWHWFCKKDRAHEARYGATPLTRNAPLLRPYSRTLPRVMQWSYGGGLFFMSEVPLHFEIPS